MKISDLNPGDKVSILGSEYYLRYIYFRGYEVSFDFQKEPLNPFCDATCLKISINREDLANTSVDIVK